MTRVSLHYPINVRPLSVIAAAHVGGLFVDEAPEKSWLDNASPFLVLENGSKISGILSLMRFIARNSDARAKLYGPCLLSNIQVPPE